MSAKRKPKRKKPRVPAMMPPPPAPQPPQATVAIVVPSKNVALDFVRHFFSGASGKTRTLALAVVISAIIIQYPWLVAWLGNELGSQVITYATNVRNVGGATLLLFFKQWNVSGGSKAAFTETTTK